jgi:alcohol dehydrogenase
MPFTALRIYETDNGIERRIETREIDDLPAGEVLIRVQYSSLNYKDALSASGHKGVTRKYPHTPGIDAVGIVETSASADFSPGDEVIVTSYDLGMNTDGGFGEYIRVPAAWVLKRPSSLSAQEAMILGTAGFTAALCVSKLASISPEQGDILVTGATGGVGSLAVALLATLGYRVVAMSGKAESHDWLRQLGAADIIGRDGLLDNPKAPLLKSRWAGAVDTVGGDILATTLKMTQQYGIVSCCGLVAGADLPITVYPFILRGVSLMGVDSALTPMAERVEIWRLLSNDWQLSKLSDLLIETDLAGLNDIYIDKILKGGIQGRVVVKIS